jgi:hypothetical protein
MHAFLCKLCASSQVMGHPHMPSIAFKLHLRPTHLVEPLGLKVVSVAREAVFFCTFHKQEMFSLM